LIEKFFNLLDNKDPEVGNILAEEVFAKDGKPQFGLHMFEGQDRMFPALLKLSRMNETKFMRRDSEK
jgi:hypothetical protein